MSEKVKELKEGSHVDALFGDRDFFFHDNNFVESFKKAPGAKTHHHNYIGGLLEHTHAVLSVCKTICEIYPELDRDLLLCVAILHDIGKIRAYSYMVSIDVTEERGLIDHVVMGYRMVEERIKNIGDFPKELFLQLLHFILNHQFG